MEKESRGYFNSPVIQKNTPIKRLGLSRKRKSCDFDGNTSKKMLAREDGFDTSPAQCQIFKTPAKNEGKEETKEKEILEVNNGLSSCENCIKTIDYEKEVKLMQERICDKEKKLNSLKDSKSNIIELEKLLALWRSACKSAYLHFVQILKEKQSQEIDGEAVLKKLGIWETMNENYPNDDDIFL